MSILGYSYLFSTNSLPNDKISDQPNLKDFADDKINVTYVMDFVMERVENIAGKGNGYQHFLLLPTILSKGLFVRVVKSQGCLVKS